MDSPDVTALRALLARATPGPWEVRTADGTVPYEAIVDRGHEMQQVAGVFARDDAALIAAAREALPGLLDRVDELKAEISRAREVISDLEVDRSDLIDEVDAWREATGLIGPGGDPSTVTPAMLKRYVGQLVRVLHAASAYRDALVDGSKPEAVQAAGHALDEALDPTPEEE